MNVFRRHLCAVATVLAGCQAVFWCAGALHNATTVHERCEVHGEFLHAVPSAAIAAAHAQSTPARPGLTTAARPADEHDVCAVAECLRSGAEAPPGAAIHEAASPPAPFRAPGAEAFARTLAPLTVAPKSSPPLA